MFQLIHCFVTYNEIDSDVLTWQTKKSCQQILNKKVFEINKSIDFSINPRSIVFMSADFHVKNFVMGFLTVAYIFDNDGLIYLLKAYDLGKEKNLEFVLKNYGIVSVEDDLSKISDKLSLSYYLEMN